jgi:small subunit ribosomal protein S5
VVRATLDALTSMTTPAEIAAKRGKSVEEITGQ